MAPTAYKHNRDVQYTCEMGIHDQQIHKQKTTIIPTIIITPPDSDLRIHNQIAPAIPTIVISPPKCDQLIHKQITLAVPTIVITPPMRDQQIHNQISQQVPTIVITPPKCDKQITPAVVPYHCHYSSHVGSTTPKTKNSIIFHDYHYASQV